MRKLTAAQREYAKRMEFSLWSRVYVAAFERSTLTQTAIERANEAVTAAKSRFPELFAE